MLDAAILALNDACTDEGMGANAVVGLRIMTSMIMSGAAEILAYGTAVVVDDAAG